MLDWQLCQKCYPLEIKILLFLLNANNNQQHQKYATRKSQKALNMTIPYKKKTEMWHDIYANLLA